MGLALIKGMGLGAGLMYFFDPDLGRRRRALVADQCTHARHEFTHFFGASTRDLGNRARGLTAELTRQFREHEAPDDEVLVERVRAILGRYVSQPGEIEVAARGGHVLLRGPILEGELEGALGAVGVVPGVIDVADELSFRRGPGLSSPHDGGPRRGPQPELLPENISPAARLIMGVAGVTLALPIVRRAPLAGLALGSVGLFLATRPAGRERAGAGRPSAGAKGSGDSLGGAEYRASGGFDRGQHREQGRPIEGGSERTRKGGALVGGTPRSGPPAGDQARNDP
jgi:hypothetical protein